MYASYEEARGVALGSWCVPGTGLVVNVDSRFNFTIFCRTARGSVVEASEIVYETARRVIQPQNPLVNLAAVGDALAARWTSERAPAITGALADPSQEEIRVRVRGACPECKGRGEVTLFLTVSKCSTCRS